MGVCSLSARIGSIIAPYIVMLVRKTTFCVVKLITPSFKFFLSYVAARSKSPTGPSKLKLGQGFQSFNAISLKNHQKHYYGKCSLMKIV